MHDSAVVLHANFSTLARTDTLKLLPSAHTRTVPSPHSCSILPDVRCHLLKLVVFDSLPNTMSGSIVCLYKDELNRPFITHTDHEGRCDFVISLTEYR